MDPLEARKSSEKAILMRTVDLILKADDASINILKSNTMSNARAVERNSKSIKDPDPLSSAMANNSLKWPITLNVDRMQNIEGLNTDDIASWDSRKHKRKQCTFRVVDKWISSSSTPNEKDVEAVTSLFNHKVKRLEEIKKVDWSRITFKIANVNLDRLCISTNPDFVEVPKDVREDAIMQVLCGDSVVEYRKISEEYKEAIKNVISRFHFNNASIPNLVNFVKSFLDPKMRTIPCLPGMKKNFVDISHILVQPRYKAIGLSKYVGKEKGQTQLVTKACQVALVEYNERKSVNNVRNCLSNILILDTPAIDLLAESDENVYVRCCKALCGMPVKPEIDLPSLKLSPYPTKVRAREITHASSGLKYIVHEGEETISFSHRHTNGSFTHNGTMLYSVTMKKTAPSTIRDVLSKIATFCKVGIEKTDKRSMKAVREQMKSRNFEKPWECVHSTQREWNFGMKKLESQPLDEEITIGKMNLVSSIDYIPAGPTSIDVKEGIGYNGNGQEVLRVPRTSCDIWPDSIDTSSSHYFNYLHPAKAVLRSMTHIGYHITTYLRFAREKNWKPPCSKILDYVDPKNRDAVRETAKEMVTTLMEGKATKDTFLFSLLYTFTAQGQTCEERVTEFYYNAKDTISFHMDKGAVVRETGQRGGKVYGQLIRNDNAQIDAGFMYQGLIPDIKFMSTYDKSKDRGKILSLMDLEAIAPDMPLNQEKIVSIQGSLLLARKEIQLASDTHKTIQRISQRRFVVKQETDMLKQILARGKRKREEDIDELYAAKRPRINTVMDMAIYGSLSSGSS